MLTALEIENFKGIAVRQRIDFAPLTLLFGANSAGKSTILQALLYLHEILERGSADVDRTDLGGDVLELGGFARLVHRHKTEDPITFRVEFATPGTLERFGRDVSKIPFVDLDDEIDGAWVELTVRLRRTANFSGPVVDSVTVGVTGFESPLVWLEAGSQLREGEPLYARVNLRHELLAKESDAIRDSWASISIPDAVAEIAFKAKREELEGSIEHTVGLIDGSAFDGSDLPLFAISRQTMSALPPLAEPFRVIPFGDDSPNKTAVADQVRTFLEMVVLGTTSQLAGFLRDAQYIGPLRTIPPRGFLYERAGRITSWADGLAAWDLLLADRLTLVDRTNTWLRRLGAGCQVVVQQLLESKANAEEVSDGHVDKTVRRLLLDTGASRFVLPSEVGAGISQLVPVIVAAIEGRGGLTLVEQPEIHVHPALQVGLGDLLIDAANRKGNRRALIVETHSEHLILRLLRRIGETTNKRLPTGVPPFSPEDLSVLWVEGGTEGTRIKRLRVDAEGEFLDRWPQGFFEERAEELF